MNQKEITAIQNNRKVTRKQAVQIWQDENPTQLDFAKAVKSNKKLNSATDTPLAGTTTIPPLITTR